MKREARKGIREHGKARKKVAKERKRLRLREEWYVNKFLLQGGREV